MKKIFNIMVLLMMMFSVLGSAFATSFDELTPEEQETFLSQSFKVDQKVTVLKDGFFSSSTAQTLAVQDPFASAGQPVMIEFTLSNVGAEFPFNQIPLPADSFALMLAIDPDINFRTSSGTEIDWFERMNGIEKFLTVTRLGAVKFGSEVKNEITGRQCEFIDVFDNLPKSAQEEIIEKNDGVKPDGVFAWDCIRVTNEEFFQDSVEDNCKSENYDSTCLAKVNKRSADGGFTDSTVVALTSDVTKGTCEAVRGGSSVVSFLSKSVVKCGIGQNGLQPGDSVTLRFYAVVPADTPTVSPDDLDQSNEVRNFQSFSQSCLDSQFPQNCHTIYAGVYPIKTKNLISMTVEGATDTLQFGSCGFQKLYKGSNIDFTDCVRSRVSGVSTIGEPIWEGTGIFYVLAPDLSGQVALVLIGATALGVMGGVTSTRRRR